MHVSSIIGTPHPFHRGVGFDVNHTLVNRVKQRGRSQWDLIGKNYSIWFNEFI